MSNNPPFFNIPKSQLCSNPSKYPIGDIDAEKQQISFRISGLMRKLQLTRAELFRLAKLNYYNMIYDAKNHNFWADIYIYLYEDYE